MNIDDLFLVLYHRRYQRLLVFIIWLIIVAIFIWRIRVPYFHYEKHLISNRISNFGNETVYGNNQNEGQESFFDGLAQAIDEAQEKDKIKNNLILNFSSVVDSHENKCPFCFGNDLCDDIRKGHLLLQSYPQKIFGQNIAFGTYKNTPVAISIFSSSESFNKYDSFICKLNQNENNCTSKRYSQDVLELFSKQSVNKLNSILEVNNLNVGHAGNLLCLTDGLLEQLQDALFKPGDVPSDQYVMFFTALVIQPEVINLKFLSQEKLDLPFPVLVGTCGRVMVIEHTGEPLERFLSEAWERRADLALKLIDTINSFLESDDSLIIIFQGFTFDSIYVTEDNQIVIMNTRHLTFVDKNLIDEFELPENDPICNEKCLQRFKSDLFNHSSMNQEKACNKAKVYGGNLMYRDLCQSIFSDMSEHIEMNIDAYHPGQGLLHSIPKGHSTELKSALIECIHENAENDRMHAIEELQEILSLYTSEVHV